MQAKVTITRDLLTPALRRLVGQVSDKRPILYAMGTQLVSLTQRAFNDASLRPSPWAPVKTGRPPLKKSGLLWRSPRITHVGGRSVTVGTDRPYAAYHQFGTGPYVIRARTKKALHWPGARHPVKSVRHPGLPARPFFPFDGDGRMIPSAVEKIRAVVEAKLRAILPKS